ncbi:hypothetical protein [Nitratidesulfovibrio liaohensis]|uniref:Uncharacterized protein n=1 Tax=Nitratidesulfovibrio liaohensis TaxID=2604158 RepID=A0ABY9R4F8_9BACT|nr:hypothetical protein [Nitratidesulfovibrio liaohensis]WMW66635.1 hypothetical protein KPS_001237 [Nitratidesulfovibrio liaohensis]HEU6435840.1 hypothetical protein [Nitratidesulfovibrio sp.]
MTMHDGIDVTAHGRLFAREVLRRPTLTPDEMPDLARDKVFTSRDAVGRAAVVAAIRREAGSILVASGHPEPLVRKVLKLEGWWQPGKAKTDQDKGRARR